MLQYRRQNSTKTSSVQCNTTPLLSSYNWSYFSNYHNELQDYVLESFLKVDGFTINDLSQKQCLKLELK